MTILSAQKVQHKISGPLMDGPQSDVKTIEQILNFVVSHRIY